MDKEVQTTDTQFGVLEVNIPQIPLYTTSLKPLTNIINSFSFDKLEDTMRENDNIHIISVDDMFDILEEIFQIDSFEDLMEYFTIDIHNELDNFISNNIQLYSKYYFLSNIKSVCSNSIKENVLMLKSYKIDITKMYELDLQQFEDTIITESLRLYFDMKLGKHIPRSLKWSFWKSNSFHNVSQDIIVKNLELVREKDASQPEQRTKEWYENRYNLLSASSIWKAIGTQKQQNSLIYEKCCPLNTDKYKSVNINSALHWGQKYEPISQMYYEYINNCEITEYGCIPHSNYKFLGASPDGIVTKSQNPELLGRMLEIKNIVNREITGIPKHEYWVQTQLQMECCDLYECDFLECRFKEYESFNDYEKDINDDNPVFNKTKDGKWKGIYMCFMKQNSNIPIYEYMPLHIDNSNDYNEWNDTIMNKYSTQPNTYWVRNYCWYLEQVSCVLIPRNTEWFNTVLPQFESLWNTIVRERVEGYEHRAPTKRGSKTSSLQNNTKNQKIPKMSKLANIIKINI